MDNQDPYIEEEHIIQLPKGKVQKDEQRSTKHTYTITDRVTRTPLNIVGKIDCFGRVSSSCSSSDTRLFSPATHSVISHEWVQDNIYATLSYS